jgi:hypothetical protein
VNSSRWLWSTVLLICGAAGLTACTEDTSAPPPTPTVTAPAPATEAPSPDPSVSPTSSAAFPTADDISCDTMLVPAVDEQLRAEGLTPAPKRWTQFGFTPTGAALECPWGTPDSMHSERYYAWAELNSGERETFIALVEQNGYRTEDGADGIWVLAPDDGYPGPEGFLISDEWVVIADTREQIEDIVWVR